MLLVALSLVLAAGGCTDDPTAPLTDASPAAGASAASSAVVSGGPLRVTPPAVVSGEVTRTVVTEGRQDVRSIATPRPGTEYAVQMRCTSPSAQAISYEISTEGSSGPMASGTLLCDGKVSMNGLGSELPPARIAVQLGTGAEGLGDVMTGYAVVAPLRRSP